MGFYRCRRRLTPDVLGELSRGARTYGAVVLGGRVLEPARALTAHAVRYPATTLPHCNSHFYGSMRRRLM